MSKHKEVFDRNIERVNSLCNLYKSIKEGDNKEGKEIKFTDVLRSAVIMLHSSFETYFRSVLCEVFPRRCTEDDLKSISFVGSEGRHREKIALGQLLALRNKTVNDVITESICETLNCTSFNNYSDIHGWAQKAKIDIKSFTEQDKLEKMISRRHKIAHEADNKGTKGYELTAIKESNVREWIEIVCKLVEVIESDLEDKSCP